MNKQAILQLIAEVALIYLNIFSFYQSMGFWNWLSLQTDKIWMALFEQSQIFDLPWHAVAG